MSRLSDFDDYPFSSPQNWHKCMDFLKFSSQVKIWYLTQLWQVFTTIKWL